MLVGSVLLGFDCPDRDHRVQGGPAGRRTRSAPPTLDPAAAHLVLAPTRRTGRSTGSGIPITRLATPDAHVQPDTRLAGCDVVFLGCAPALAPVTRAVIVSALVQAAHANCAGRIDPDGQVVVTHQLRPGGIHAFDDDDAGTGDLVQFARSQLAC